MAGALDQFGLGPDGASLGNATIASPNPAYAAYYNPAAVAEQGTNLSVGLVQVDWDLKDLNSGYRSPSTSLLPPDSYQASRAQSLEAGFVDSFPPHTHLCCACWG